MSARDGSPDKPRALRVGERVLLRHPCPSDREEWKALRRDSSEFLMRWEPRPPVGDGCDDAAFDRYVETANTERNQRHCVCLIETGAIIGHVALNEIMRGPAQFALMGYWIGEPYAGQGLMTEAISICLARAFEDLDLHRVEANMLPTNIPSRRLARAVGMRCEGYSPRYIEIDGQWRDHERFAITIEEWREPQPK